MGSGHIPLSVPNLKGNELKYITHAIKTEWVSSGGPYVGKFEENIASYVNSKGAVSCQNGTAGLHIALRICNVGDGDEVIVPSLTFIATVNPVKYVGANPIFMDCDDSLNMDPDKVEEFCERECSFSDGVLINKTTGKRVKAIIVVHVFGNMANMPRIMEIGCRFNLKVIEDATEALGTRYIAGKYDGKYAGTIGHVGIYSFNGNKIITTGGGGMIVSDDEDLLFRARHLTTQAKVDELYYTHDEVGYNYRMTNVQAALGLAQLEQLEKFIQTKAANYRLYKKLVGKIEGLRILDFEGGTRPNYWFYALFTNHQYALDRDGIIHYLASMGIQARPLWGLISEQRPYRGCQQYRIEKAIEYHKHIVNLPCSSNLTQEEVLFVVECLKSPKRV